MTTTTSTKIRAFNGDYDALARLHNQTFAEFAQSAEEFRFDDEKRPERCRNARWMAERDGQIVGYGGYDQHPGIWHPRKFSLEIAVEPDLVQRGIGSALYSTLIDALRAFNPLSVDAWSRDDMPCYVRFLGDRGFVEDMRLWVSTLDVSTYDPAPFERYKDRVRAQGIEIKTRAELRDEPDLTRKLYELWTEVRNDLPLPPGETRIETPLAEWQANHEHPSRLDDAYFVAIADGQMVGTSQLWRSLDEPDLLRTGLTGVRRAYRRRGIAFALKLHALDFARAYGAQRVITDNESRNRPMLAINEALGFVKHPAWIHYRAEWAAASARR